VEPGIDGAREALDFLHTTPIVSSYRTVVVLSADKMQLPSQDAYLKILEEPPPYSKILFVCDDIDLLSPPLRSRVRNALVWHTLSEDEMRMFAAKLGVLDELVLVNSGGRPGIYATMRGDQRLEFLFRDVRDLVLGGKNLLLEKSPSIMIDLDSKSPIRPAVAFMISRVAMKCVGADPIRVVKLLKYAALLTSVSSVNAEMQWMRLVSELTCRS
jgi:hypothetical protein